MPYSPARSPRRFALRCMPLLALAAFAALASASPAQQPLTAAQAIAKIVAANGAPPVPNTVDTIKAGDPNTPVTGVATTFMDTLDVLRAAVAHGDNLIVTHEPTFYNHPDDRGALPGDPVVAEKLKYIEDHHLVVWRFHDGWHKHVPDGILTGMVAELGLGTARQGADPHLFVLSQPVTVLALATRLEEKTDGVAVRIVGDPSMKVTKMALLPGASGLTKQVGMLTRPDVQVVVVGEATEWEGIPYARDAAAEGRGKAMILLGHNASEEGGMRYCAEWLHGVLPGMRIDFLPAGEAFSAVVTRTSTR